MGATMAERRLKAVVLYAMEAMAAEAIGHHTDTFVVATMVAGLASGVLPLGGSDGRHGRDVAVGATRGQRRETSKRKDLGV